MLHCNFLLLFCYNGTITVSVRTQKFTYTKKLMYTVLMFWKFLEWVLLMESQFLVLQANSRTETDIVSIQRHGVIYHVKYLLSKMVKTKNHTVNCLGRCSTMRVRRSLVGFSEQSKTRFTFLSPRSSKPLARTPTLITPFSILRVTQNNGRKATCYSFNPKHEILPNIEESNQKEE